MAVEIKNAKGLADNLARQNALQTLENKCTTTQLKKFAELSKIPNAPQKFEENFETLKTFL